MQRVISLGDFKKKEYFSQKQPKLSALFIGESSVSQSELSESKEFSQVKTMNITSNKRGKANVESNRFKRGGTLPYG